MTKPQNISTLPKVTPFVKKALIIGAAALGLIAAGAVAFVASRPNEEEEVTEGE